MKLRSILSAVAVAAATQISAAAAVITFTLSSSDLGNDSNQFSKTVSGLTVTFTDPYTEGQGFSATTNGLELGEYYANAPTSFYFFFDKEVKLVSYEIYSGNTGTFDLTSSGGAQYGNSLAVGSHFFDSITLNAEDWAFLEGNLIGDNAKVLIQSISVEVVPEPSSLLLLSGALVGGLVMLRRSRKA